MSEPVPFELSALADAKRYQQWVADTVAPYLGRRILEVGAGIGSMSAWLPRRERLVLTELDPGLYGRLSEAPWVRAAAPVVEARRFDVAGDDLTKLDAERFDTIVSFNVLEHIEDDEEAVRRLADLLRRSTAPGPKRLVTFVPAHMFAYGATDKTFGHHRRYDVARVERLREKAAPDARLEHRFMNLVGLAGWIWNGRLRGRAEIGRSAIRTFEWLNPVLRPIDERIYRWLRLPLGQSLLFVLSWN